MSLYHMLIASMALFLLLHFVAIPPVERRLEALAGINEIPSFAFHRVLSVLRTACLLAFLSSLCVAGTLSYIKTVGGLTAVEVEKNLVEIQSWRSTLLAGGAAWSAFLVLALTAIACFLAHRAEKARLTEILEESLEQDVARVDKEFEEGKWEELPPNEEMKEIDASIAMLADAMAEIDADSPTAARDMKHGLERLTRLQRMRHSADRFRRIQEPILDPEAAYIRPRNWKEWLRTIVTSEGTVTSLRGVRRLAFAGSLFLLVPSLMGVQSTSLDASLGQREIVLRDLYVTTSEAEARKALEEAVAKNGITPLEKGTDDKEDEAIIEEISAAFESAVVSEVTANDNDSNRSTNRSLRHAPIRKLILAHAAQGAPERLVPLRSVSEASGLDAKQRTALELVEHRLEKGKRSGALAEEAQKSIRRLKEESPSTFAAIKEQFKRRKNAFAVPAKSGNVARAAVSEVFGMALNNVGDLDTPLGRSAHELAGLHGARPLKSAHNMQVYAYLQAIAEGRSPQDAAKATSRFESSRHVFTDNPAQTLLSVSHEYSPRPEVLATHAPALDVAARDRKAAAEAAVIASDIRTRTPADNPIRRRQATEVVMGYADHFPGQPDSVFDTLHARIAPPEWSPSHLPIGGSRTPSLPHVGFHAASRARNFGALRTFSRIGGVLIGREPDQMAPPDITDFSWQEQQGTLTFVLTRRDGTKLEKGPFRKSIIHDALVYAADGRPITATMVTASPLAELQILAHPALVDTPLGCRAIELDRFVDMYTGQHAEREKATIVVDASAALYKRAWSQRALFTLLSDDTMLEQVKNGTAPSNISHVLQTAMLISRQDGGGAKLALKHIAEWSDPTKSPLRVKSEYFSTSLVKDMAECASDSETIETFDGCIKVATVRRLRSMSSAEKHGLLNEPPEFQIWSGVREASFTLDSDLSFLAPPPTNVVSAEAWPIEFMLQVAFASVPAFLPAGQSPDEYVETTSWEFPELKNMIQEQVRAGVAKDPAAASIVRDIWEFTVLQRFFRAAFDDALGDEVPMKLLPLLKASNVVTPPCRTPRWNTAPGKLEVRFTQLLLAAQDALDQTAKDGIDPYPAWFAMVKRETQTCAKLITKSVESKRNPSKISDVEWDDHCGFAKLDASMPSAVRSKDTSNRDLSEQLRLARLIVEEGYKTTQARMMRVTLGIADDESAKQFSCPAP